ncbi:hypothetical protein BT63DRAFT_478234 [Microthyrium microscopicum]|uniref:Uncharacterized protein n=1 Tax=Microthyrium microscopicum TaxID=703497 RepID=A0A6A6UEF7_9PEZI|nr:hypothetical protein BT63DRAFT_478234 [Microthyrium microscopicum]
MSLLNAAKNWAPFKINALGIITLVGADPLRASLARLVPSKFEYLPLFASQIFVDNTITASVPGFTLYNITDGILSTDLSTWWARWLLCQEITFNTTKFDIDSIDKPRSSSTIIWIVTIVASLLANACLIVVPFLMGDWYGLAASVSLIATTLTRNYMLVSLRQSVDRLVSRADNQATPVKLLLVLPSNRMVTIYTTRGITTEVLLTEATPSNERLYSLARVMTWIASGILVVCLGSACLAVQLIIISTTVGATVAVTQQVGCDEHHIGTKLEIKQRVHEGGESRKHVYVQLDLNAEQEAALLSWHFMPMEYNKHWWTAYRGLVEEYREDTAKSERVTTNGNEGETGSREGSS